MEIIIADNGSEDGTPDAVRAAFPSVRVLCLGENRYSAGGRNAGAAEAKGEYVFFVDDDNVLDPSCIGALADAMHEDPGLGIVAPIMLDHGRPGVIWCAGGRMNRAGIAVHLYANKKMADLDLPRFIGAEYFPNAYMVRASLIREGLTNDTEHFPHNWAEQDICARARMRGSRLATVTAAITHHDIGYGGMFTRISEETAYDQARGRIFYRRKHMNSPWQWIMFFVVLFPVSTLWYIRAFASRRSGRFLTLLRAYVRGTVDGFRIIV
jgi:GT2 family glycosyltransferase